MRRFPTLIASVVLAALLFSGRSSHAETVTFDGSGHSDGDFFTGYVTPSGFEVSGTLNLWSWSTTFGNSAPSIDITSGAVTVTRDSPPAAGTLFDFTGVDLLLFNGDLGGATVSGYLNGGLQFQTTAGLLGGGFSTYGTGYSSFVLDKLTIQVSALSGPLGGGTIYLDNIGVEPRDAVTGTTPEPASFLLLATGLAGAIGLVRRRCNDMSGRQGTLQASVTVN